jgi:hypothetical protein
MIDRYFSGEDFKKGEWINGKSVKFKIGLSLVIVMTPFIFGGFFTTGIFCAPFSLIGMVLGFMTGDFFLKSYDWANKGGAKKAAADIKDENEAGKDDGPKLDEKKPESVDSEDKTRQSVVDAIQSAGSSIKEGLKSVGEGIAKASETVFKDGKDGAGKENKENEAGDKKEKKNYESNKKLDDKLNNY